MTAIRSIYRWGRQWRVLTACGHAFDVTTDELNRRQLYLGKRIPCQACAPAQAV